MFKGKKGSIEEAAFLSVILVGIAIFAYPFINSVLTINNDVQDISGLDNRAKNINNDLSSRLPAIFDGIYLIALLISYLGVFFTAVMLRTHPVLLVGAIIFFIVFALVVPLLANAWDAITDGQFSLASSELVVIPFIMQNYLRVSAAMFLFIVVGFTAKKVMAS